MLLVTGDAIDTEAAAAAVRQAADPGWDVDSAAELGVWAVPEACTEHDDVMAAAGRMGERSYDAIRTMCAEHFASAEHADPASIPYPADRLPDGYLPDGAEEFVFEDEEAGLWAYLSQTLQVQIIRYAMSEVPHRWFEAEVIFKPEAERLTQHVYVNATFPGQQIYPETLAQTSRLVFAINGDYYPYRASKNMGVGNIIRQGELLYSFEPKKTLKYPNLDTIAIHDDGSLSVSAGAEISAEELLAQGDIHDSLSFGPYLARDGRLRVYNGNSALVAEPRSALGMIEPGHYLFVMVEGKMPKKGEQGMGLVELAELMYARGVTDACNVDGGSTAVMVFMGHKLNRTGKGSSLGAPRNQHELFGIGTSEKVYTDKVNGK